MTIIDLLFPILNCFETLRYQDPVQIIAQNNYELSLNNKEYKKVMKKIKKFRKNAK